MWGGGGRRHRGGDDEAGCGGGGKWRSRSARAPEKREGRASGRGGAAGRRHRGGDDEGTRRSGGLRRREGENELGFVRQPPPLVAYIRLQPAVGLLAGRGPAVGRNG
jgi:hypothetical protein